MYTPNITQDNVVHGYLSLTKVAPSFFVSISDIAKHHIFGGNPDYIAALVILASNSAITLLCAYAFKNTPKCNISNLLDVRSLADIQ
jgi:hypothetical protein